MRDYTELNERLLKWQKELNEMIEEIRGSKSFYCEECGTVVSKEEECGVWAEHGMCERCAIKAFR